MKRVERKQLKGDEFVSGMGQFLDFMKGHEKELMISAGALVGVILIFLGVLALRAGTLRKESRVAGEILSLRADLDKTPGNLTRLEKLAGPGKYARLAYLELATYWIEKGDLDKAEKMAAAVKLAPKDLIYYEAQDLLAQIKARKRDFAQALEIYVKLEKDKPESYPLDAILFHKAEVLEKKGDVKEALAAYKKLQEEYSQTYFGYEASMKVGRLEPAK
jgi:predicted negative regulator of RcsB-dependent stress response